MQLKIKHKKRSIDETLKMLLKEGLKNEDAIR